MRQLGQVFQCHSRCGIEPKFGEKLWDQLSLSASSVKPFESHRRSISILRKGRTNEPKSLFRENLRLYVSTRNSFQFLRLATWNRRLQVQFLSWIPSKLMPGR